MSNELVYSLQLGKFINRFLHTPVYEKREHFVNTTMTGRINQWLKEGFSIHDNPCRKEFLQRMMENPAVCPDLSACVGMSSTRLMGEDTPITLYLPHGNVDVNHSGFWHVPTSLVSYYVTWLEVPQAKTYKVRLSTCGGATLWLNGEELVSFRPFTRNMVKETSFLLPLPEGRSQLTVTLEDLAERDTDYYFRLEVEDGEEITMHLPMAPQVDCRRLQEVETILDNACLRLDKELDGVIRIDMENTSAQPLAVRCFVKSADIASIQEQGDGQDHPPIVLQSGERDVVVRQDHVLPPDVYSINLSADIGGQYISRHIGAQLTWKQFVCLEDEDFDARKERLMDFAANASSGNSYRAVAMLARGGDAALADSFLQREIPGIRQHKDCSDFYLIAHLYALKHYRSQLSAKTVQDMEDAIFTFRYWIDEPGNDVMWFFSENHALLFHACQYIAGQMYPDTIFTASGLTGRQAAAKAEKLLNGWFDDFDTEFMTEWNSNAYLPIDTLAFGFMLLMIEPDCPLHVRVEKALDRIFLCLAQYGHKNSYAASYGRSYEKQLKGNYINGTSSLLYFGYGKGYITSNTGPFVPLCLSSYHPPEEYRRYLELGEGEEMFLAANQGYEEHVNLTLYKTSQVMLSTANAFKPYQPGYQEHIVQATLDPLAQCFVNHPGESHAYGSGRPSYWAGNGTLPLAMQWQDTAVLRFKNPQRSLVGYTHAYFPMDAFDKVIHGDNWYAGQKDGGYVLVWAMNGLRRQQQGPYRMEELISDGCSNVWLVRVSDAAHYPTLEAFASATQCSTVALQDDSVTLHVGELGDVTLADTPSLTVNNCTHLPDYRGDKALMTLTAKGACQG